MQNNCRVVPSCPQILSIWKYIASELIGVADYDVQAVSERYTFMP